MIQRTVMRYHGGNFGGGGYLADWIIAHLPPHRVYVEPFGGATSVLMRKPRAYAEVYNDLAGEVVNVFRVLRDQPTELERLLRLTPFAREEFDASCVPTEDKLEQARRTIFRSLAGFGSAAATKGYRTGFRANSNRSGTTPDWPLVCTLLRRHYAPINRAGQLPGRGGHPMNLWAIDGGGV